MNNFFTKSPNVLKGILFIIVGSILLLYALNLIGIGFDLLVILCSVGLILYGVSLITKPKLFQTYYKKAIAIFKKQKPIQ